MLVDLTDRETSTIGYNRYLNKNARWLLLSMIAFLIIIIPLGLIIDNEILIITLALLTASPIFSILVKASKEGNKFLKETKEKIK